MEGFDWDGQTCVPTDLLPNGTDCEEGFHWDSLLGQCIEIDVEVPEVPEVPKPECLAGESWSEFDQKCIPDIIECVEGFEWDGQTCVEIPEVPEVPDLVECMEGWEWSDLYGKCIEKIDDDVSVVECMEGWEWSDLYGECIEKINDDTQCPEGWVSEDGHCVEIKKPDIDIPTPEFGGGNAAAGHNFQHQGLFDYTNIDVYQGAPIEPWKKALNTAKGMLS
jgi:hypothetical protein